MKKNVIAIFGPTGVGKTALSIKLAKNIGEIISVDSMQVYRYMNIGTAKASNDEIEKVKHHLIDIIDPDGQYTVGHFIRDVNNLIPQILDRDKIPFLVGGTGLYFSSLIRGMLDIPKIDEGIKKRLVLKYEKIGQSRMYSILQKIDEEYSTMIHPNDKQRTLRALEVFLGTKIRFSSFLKRENKKSNYNFVTVGINIDRQDLYNIINQRVDKMIEAGLVDEVKTLLDKGYQKNHPGMNAIGYKEIVEYLDKKYSFEEAVDTIKKNTRRYAKRQLTWFRRVDNVAWFSNDEYNKIEQYIAKKADISFDT